jgi:DNA-binding CsgD family transcriptional regulator/tetratricopeptide (TPR) repeat protein
MARGDSVPGRLVLRGRRDECAVLDGLLEDARAGQSGALVLRGDAGIGKTALLDDAIESSSDMRVLRAIGVEAEMELAFAALHQLCAPLLDRLDRLPGPQRDALQTTFGLSAGPVPDRFFVGLAVLGLLSEVAEERPILCVVDDAQWLDKASAQTLAFVARRLLADSVVVLFAAREPGEDLTSLPNLLVEGLRGSDARSLLASVIPGRLDDEVSDELLAETRGNPLALLELPRGLSAAQLAGGFALPRALSLSSRIEESFVNRLEAFPAETQRLLLAAAAEPLGDGALLARAAERLGIAGAMLERAESAGLIEIDGRVRFRHPLVRSAIYRAAAPNERRLVHRALGEATDARVDRDRRAWHLAEAADGPDERVAAELERAASRAQSRGGLAAAAAFLERATELTPEPLRRAQRALTAAQTKYEAGALDDAVALLTTAETGILDDIERARVHLLRAEIAFAARRGSDAPPLLLGAARELEAVDPVLARATYLEALSAAMFSGRLTRGPSVEEVSEAALAGPPPPQPPRRPPDLLLQGWAIRFTKGYPTGATILKQALSAFRCERGTPAEEVQWLSLACRTAADLWDDETWRLLSARQLEVVKETGAMTAMPTALSGVSHFLAISGELSRAESLLDEMRAAVDAIGMAVAPYPALWLAALRGRDAELSQLSENTARDAVARGEGLVLAITEHVSAILNNGLGRFPAAMAAVRDAGERPNEIGSPTWAAAELIEAAIRCGELPLAERALERLAETTSAAGTNWALGIEARSRALLGEGNDAERLYLEAIERLCHTSMRVQLGRAHLLYGEWLRRERRRVDAREQLRAAFEMFTAMGVEAFAGRAERELLATGERVRKRSVETRDDLTAQEAQVARLARDGLSNVEIGQRLFISQHTVSYHLRKVFAKLGITSRTQLDQVMPDNAQTLRIG